MKKLDLHGVRHGDVRHKLIQFIEASWGKNEEVEIITGCSEPMKAITKKVLDEYKLEYKVGDILGINNGYITTTIS